MLRYELRSSIRRAREAPFDNLVRALAEERHMVEKLVVVVACDEVDGCLFGIAADAAG
jgi:hypothetical protein